MDFSVEVEPKITMQGTGVVLDAEGNEIAKVTIGMQEQSKEINDDHSETA